MRDLMLAALMPVVLICGFLLVNRFGRFADKSLRFFHNPFRSRRVSLSRREGENAEDSSDEDGDVLDSPPAHNRLQHLRSRSDNPGVIAYLPGEDGLLEDDGEDD